VTQRKTRWPRTVAVRLSGRQAQALEALADESGMAMSDVLRAALDALVGADPLGIGGRVLVDPVAMPPGGRAAK
jgi:hypothetical protein